MVRPVGSGVPVVGVGPGVETTPDGLGVSPDDVVGGSVVPVGDGVSIVVGRPVGSPSIGGGLSSSSRQLSSQGTVAMKDTVRPVV